MRQVGGFQNFSVIHISHNHGLPSEIILPKPGLRPPGEI
jgi:hypothetical protein